MKRFIWVLLVIGAVAQPLSKTGIYMLFQANRAYIAAHLCEKREIPASDCQGKCYLNKKLKQDGEKQQQTPQAQKQVNIDMIPAVAGLKIEKAFYEQLPEKAPVRYGLKTYPALSYSIFHPPKVLT